MFADINFVGVFIAAILGFLLGALWYSQALFGKAWTREEACGGPPLKPRHGGVTYLLTFLLLLVAAGAFAVFLGTDTPVGVATLAGLMTGIGWVCTTLGINYLFARRSLKLFLINGGYYTALFTLYGFILGIWH